MTAYYPMLHRFSTSIAEIPLPEKFTYPFCYTPHPLCVLAAEEVKSFLSRQTEWTEELQAGKMFGVLLIRDEDGEIGYLAAYSGILAGRNDHPFFVPPVYDLLNPDGFFKKEEEQISRINLSIREMEEATEYKALQEQLDNLQQEAEKDLRLSKSLLKEAKQRREAQRQSGNLTEEAAAALIRESQFQKAEYKRKERNWKERLLPLQKQTAAYEQQIRQLKTERKERSSALQQRLFSQFRLLNRKGETRNLCDIFAHTAHKIPPAGAGECAGPKLLQQAYLHHWTPLAMAEFWYGNSPQTEIRHHGHYYPACQGKCAPILSHMLQGLEVDPNPLVQQQKESAGLPLETVFEDEWLAVVCKPAGMLSVPGKEETVSVYDLMRQRYPSSQGPLLVHRLDMATSGLLLVAKTKQTHQALQALFKKRQIKKRYIALLQGCVAQDQGVIRLPIGPSHLDRPRQMVDETYGKPAITLYTVLNRTAAYTRVAFYPQTGRTHQLRIHAAHPAGLHCPIMGDELYGTKAERLYLHAEMLEFIHPVTGKLLHIERKADF